MIYFSHAAFRLSKKRCGRLKGTGDSSALVRQPHSTSHSLSLFTVDTCFATIPSIPTPYQPTGPLAAMDKEAAAAEEEDEFFGDQSCDDEFGTAEAEFRDVKTLSYLDGFDETKEEKLQEGFAEGYSKTFNDAFQTGTQLGSICAKQALCELNQDITASQQGLNNAASAIHQFLRDEIMIGGEEGGESSYEGALDTLQSKLDSIESDSK